MPPAPAAAPTNGLDLIRRRHPEWIEHHVRWSRMLDALEGGDRFRYAIYGTDTLGMPVRNLLRHKREYPAAPGAAGTRKDALSAIAYGNMGLAMPANYMSEGGYLWPATDNDYDLRLQRTPVPTFVKEAITKHLSRIFSREVRRQGPDELVRWWRDVDGMGTCVDDWMADTIAPILLAVGHIDLTFDRPPAPGGAAVASRAAEKALGVDRCVVGYVLPQNLVWWRLDDDARDGTYAECLAREYQADDQGRMLTFYRHYARDAITLYDWEGRRIKDWPNTLDAVPVRRVFARRKPRCRNIGQSEYDDILDYQVEYYNRDSELILSDTIQAHPLLSGPEDYCRPDGEIAVGPGHLLPKKKVVGASGQASYEGFEFVGPDKGPAESLRQNKQDMRDEVDRKASLAKPAGASGGGTVAQSGISKGFDFAELNDLLTHRTKVLARCERVAAAYALAAIRGEAPDLDADGDGPEGDAVVITYPAEFDLLDAESLAKLIAEIQGAAQAGGALPETEKELFKRLVRQSLPGLADDRYEALDDEIDAFLDGRAEAMQQQAEGADLAAAGRALNQLTGNTIVEAEANLAAPPAGETPPAPAPPGKAPAKGKGKPPAKAKG